jgi:hypothetical protein
MGYMYEFEGSITIEPPLNYAEIKAATQVALGLVRPQDKKYATEGNVFSQYMPLALAFDSFVRETDEGLMTVKRASGVESPSHTHFLPISMADFMRALMKALPGHEWYGEVTAIREDGLVGYKLTVSGYPTDPTKVREVKGMAHMVWEDEPTKSIPLSALV